VKPRRAETRTTGASRGGSPGRLTSKPLHRGRRRRQQRLAGLARLALVVLILVLLAWTGARIAQAAGADEPLTGVVYVVRSGDTLWDLVSEHYGTQRHDVRALVDLVERENHLAEPALVPGQRIRFPYVPE